MACKECKAAWKMDGHIPDCERERGCVIPPLSEKGARIMAIREKLVALKGLINPATILALYGAGKDDLEMLAKVEEIACEALKRVKR